MTLLGRGTTTADPSIVTTAPWSSKLTSKLTSNLTTDPDLDCQ